MKEILALFDFCETITTFQTLSKFLPLAAAHNASFSPRENLARRKRYQERGLAYPRFEELIDLELGLAQDLAGEFLFDEILTGLNPKIMQRLFYHQDAGHTVAIVSGGFELYIKEFAKLYKIPHVIAVELQTREQRLTGDIEGIHTMCERKLYKLADRLPLHAYDLSCSYAYSDCVSDIPLLSLVGHATVIDRGRDLRWAQCLNYEVLA